MHNLVILIVHFLTIQHIMLIGYQSFIAQKINSNILNRKAHLTCFSVQKIAIYCNMNNPLQRLSNIPVRLQPWNPSFLISKGATKKIRLLERDKHIIRVKRGLDACNLEITKYH